MDPDPTLAAATNGNLAGDEDSTPNSPQQPGLKEVRVSVERALALLHQLQLTISTFTVELQLPLLHRMNALVEELDRLQRAAERCEIQVPLEVINLIDDGKNPDEFTRDFLSSCVAKNQMIKGNADAFKSLRKHLLEELEKTFPDEVEAYREIRAASAAETKQLAQAQNTLPNGEARVKSEY